MGERSEGQRGATGWRFWISLSALLAAFIGFMILKGMTDGMSVTIAVLSTLAYVAIMAIVGVVGSRHSRRGDAEVSRTMGGEHT